MTNTALALRSYVGAFLDELAAAGVADVSLCPGSRSTPLAILAHEHPRLKAWMHLDERSASFFALGMAKASRRPVAVLCTSGTAAANFMPAVVEARFGGVPLIVLTADRPGELRDVGATQTIDQVRMYGTHVKLADEMLLPEASPAAARHARAMAARAVATALDGKPGPVHLNFPFREPLIPAPPAATPATGAPPYTVSAPVRRPDPQAVNAIARKISDAGKGIIVCGPQDDEALAPAVLRLSRVLGAPLLADALSQVRWVPKDQGPVIDSYDAFLRDPDVCSSLAPGYVIKLGATPVSKPLQQFLERCGAETQVIVLDDGAWTDPERTATHFVFADATPFCDDLAGAVEDCAGPAVDGAWLSRWRAANEAAAASIGAALDAAAEMSEPLVFRRLARVLPPGVTVFAGNSMPVRDLDSFFPAVAGNLRFMANRGASGIDGVVSTALGVAAAVDGPLVLVIGDLSLYHDMNGLLAAQRHGLSATIVLINNDGGGIFSFLPQNEKSASFEELFGTPHGLDFRHTAALYGLGYTIAGTPEEFDAAVVRSLKTDGVELIEVRTDRDENLRLHRELWAAAGTAARGGPA